MKKWLFIMAISSLYPAVSYSSSLCSSVYACLAASSCPSSCSATPVCPTVSAIVSPRSVSSIFPTSSSLPVLKIVINKRK